MVVGESSLAAPGSGASAFALDLVGYFVDLVKDVAVAVYEVGDLGGRVHHGRVVAATEGAADLGQRLVGELAAQVHGDLPRVGERLRAARPYEVGLLDAEVAADFVLDELDRDLTVRRVHQDVLEDLLGERH